MGPKARHLVEVVEHYRLHRVYPELAHTLYDARDGRLSEDEADMLQLALRPVIEQLDRVPMHLFDIPTARDLHADGRPDVPVGTLQQCDDTGWGLRLLDRPRSIVIGGAAGGGKTTAIRKMIDGIDALAKRTNRAISTIVFDRKSGEFADLPGRYGSRWLHLSAQRGAWLGLNAPQGVPARVWTFIVATLFAAAAGLVASAAVFAKAIAWLLPRLNADATDRSLWPDFHLILEVLRRDGRRFSEKGEYAQSLRTRLEEIVQASGALFRTFRGVDFEHDVIEQGRSAVIDISNLEPPFLRMYVVWCVLAQVLAARQQRGHRVGTTEVVVVIDEADVDVSRRVEERFAGGISPINTVLQMGRELGVMGVIGVHALGPVSREVLTNAPTTILFNFNDAESLLEARRMLLLPPGAERVLPALRPGECIVRQGQSCWPSPFLARVDFLPPHRAAVQPTFDEPRSVPAKTLHDLPAIAQALLSKAAASSPSAAVAGSAEAVQLSRNARQLLEWATMMPSAPVAHLVRQMGGLSSSTQKNLRKELSDAKLATIEPFRAGRQSGFVIEPSPAAANILNKPVPRLPGRGGLKHRAIAQWIVLAYKHRGKKAFPEWVAPGTTHPVDVAVQHDGGSWTAYEVISTCKENIRAHLVACLLASHAVRNVVIVLMELNDKTRIASKIESDDALGAVVDRISFQSAAHFLREAWS